MGYKIGKLLLFFFFFSLGFRIKGEKIRAAQDVRSVWKWRAISHLAASLSCRPSRRWKCFRSGARFECQLVHTTAREHQIKKAGGGDGSNPLILLVVSLPPGPQWVENHELIKPQYIFYNVGDICVYWRRRTPAWPGYKRNEAACTQSRWGHAEPTVKSTSWKQAAGARFPPASACCGRVLPTG